MGLLFRLLTVFAAVSRPAVRPLLAVSSGIVVAKRSQIPDDCSPFGNLRFLCTVRYRKSRMLWGIVYFYSTSTKFDPRLTLWARHSFRGSHDCLGIRLLHSSECVYHIMIIFENFHEISFNFTGTSVKLSVQHMRDFTVVLDFRWTLEFIDLLLQFTNQAKIK